MLDKSIKVAMDDVKRVYRNSKFVKNFVDLEPMRMVVKNDKYIDEDGLSNGFARFLDKTIKDTDYLIKKQLVRGEVDDEIKKNAWILMFEQNYSRMPELQNAEKKLPREAKNSLNYLKKLSGKAKKSLSFQTK